MRRHVGNILFDLPFDVLKQPGEVLQLGCKIDEWQQKLIAAKDIADKRPVVVIANWQWLQFRYRAPQQSEYDEAGLEPVYLWSCDVLSDSSNRWRPGDWVLAPELKQLHDGCIFESLYAVHLMVGPGVRKFIRP